MVKFTASSNSSYRPQPLEGLLKLIYRILSAISRGPKLCMFIFGEMILK